MRLAALGIVFALGLARAPAARADDPSGPIEDIATVESATTARPPGLFGPLYAPPVHLELSVDQTGRFPLDSHLGSFSTIRDRVMLGTWLPLPGPFFFGLDLEVEGSTYDGTRGQLFGARHDEETLWQMSVGPKFIDRVNDTLTLYVGTVFLFGGAIDAEVGDCLRYELDLATQFKVTGKLTLTFGCGVRTGLEAHPTFYPIAALEYGRLKLFLEGGILKTTWPLIEKAEGLHELDLVGSFGLDVRQYRLAEYSGHELTPVPGGVVRDTRYPLAVGLRYRPIVGVRATLTGGADFWEKLEVDDHLGRALLRSHGSPAPFVAFVIEIDI